MGRFFLSMVLIPLFSALGACNAQVEEKKTEYEVYIQASSERELAAKAMIETIIGEFNRNVGFKALKLVSQPGKGVSTFTLYTKDAPPKGHDSAIGVCGHREETMDEKTAFDTSKGVVNKVTIKTYMDCTFMVDYLEARQRDFGMCQLI